MDDLQGLVDALAERTRHPVVLDDHRQRMIAYSRHDGSLDDLSFESVLHRRAAPDVAAWLRQFEIPTAAHPVRTPAAPELGMPACVCIPLRHHGLLLGLLWFVDHDQGMNDDQVAQTTEFGDDFALALYPQILAEELATNAEAEAVRSLLVAEPEIRAQAARTLVEDDRFDPCRGVTALMVLPLLGARDEPDEMVRMAIEQALVHTRRQAGVGRALHLARYDHGLLLVATCDDDEAVDHARTVRAALTETVRGLDQVERVVVGVGQGRPSLDQARESYDDARHAISVAVHLPAVGPVAVWTQLGIYRALAQLMTDQMHTASVHPGLERLLEDPEAAALVDTLETYLDLAGNARATSERLDLHRTSLYYRLQRIEELACTDLKDGSERLALHLGLKLARLTGRR